MSAVIILSSSPPRVFARSPTPADESSPALPSAGTILKREAAVHKRFSTTATSRDGFLPASSSARQMLAEKVGAENKPVGSPLLVHSKLAQTSLGGMNAVQNTGFTCFPDNTTRVANATSMVTVDDAVTQASAEDIRCHSRRSRSPFPTDRATTGETDRRPSETAGECGPYGRSKAEPATFPTGLLDGCGSNGRMDEANIYIIDHQKPSKRRKIDSAEMHLASKIESLVTSTKKPTTKKPAPVRRKTPAKKSLTITGLATSKLKEPEEPEAANILQYLTASQIQLDNLDTKVLDSRIEQTKTAVKKLKRSKKVQVKSQLVSPTSAMKSFEEQEAIFGSASQLARDESPSFLRDTIEAMKCSESNFLSDPVMSPPATQALPIDETPKFGTSKFRKTRNLWAAAGRDEDNALLHIDTVDLTHDPVVRSASIGKDVLLQPGAGRSFCPSSQVSSLKGGSSPRQKASTSGVMDIDDVVTPLKSPTLQRRAGFCTAAEQANPMATEEETATTAPPAQPEPAKVKKPSATKPRKRTPKKPHYAGFTVHELQKQISAYGFKAVKKREKMVELLDRCWEEKHGTEGNEVANQEPNPEPDGLAYGEFLSNVHDVSARPVPKVKKSKAPRKKKDVTEKEKPVKKPRAPRKKKEPITGVDAPVEGEVKKVVRKRKPKASTLSEDKVAPTDDIDNEVCVKLDSMQGHDVLATSDASVSRQLKPSPSAIVCATLPSIPADVPSASPKLYPEPEISVVQPHLDTQPDSPLTNVTTPASLPSERDLDTQITKAIMQQSSSLPSGYNHQTAPTWHEKILLYDPIILEDLALWLNTEGLALIGEDSEISAIDVRTWCEGKGICCLVKGGWRGNKGKGE